MRPRGPGNEDAVKPAIPTATGTPNTTPTAMAHQNGDILNGGTFYISEWYESKSSKSLAGFPISIWSRPTLMGYANLSLLL